MEELNLGASLVRQLEHAVTQDAPPPPMTSSGGGVVQTGDEFNGYWQHFNLREQSEILQLLVLYYANSAEKVGAEELKKLWKIANGHRLVIMNYIQ